MQLIYIILCQIIVAHHRNGLYASNLFRCSCPFENLVYVQGLSIHTLFIHTWYVFIWCLTAILYVSTLPVTESLLLEDFFGSVISEYGNIFWVNNNLQEVG